MVELDKYGHPIADPVALEALREIRFVDRMFALPNRFDVPLNQAMKKVDPKQVMAVLETFSEDYKYYKSDFYFEGDFGQVGDYQFSMALIPKYGIIGHHLYCKDVTRYRDPEASINTQELMDSSVRGIVIALNTKPCYKVPEAPCFSTYEEMEEIFKELVSVTLDFKHSFLKKKGLLSLHGTDSAFLVKNNDIIEVDEVDTVSEDDVNFPFKTEMLPDHIAQRIQQDCNIGEIEALETDLRKAYAAQPNNHAVVLALAWYLVHSAMLIYIDDIMPHTNEALELIKLVEEKNEAGGDKDKMLKYVNFSGLIDFQQLINDLRDQAQE